MLSLLKFFAHSNKYAYVEFNTLKNQYTVQNYRYYATNQHRLVVQPEENELINTFFFRFRNYGTYEFCSNFSAKATKGMKSNH